MTAPFALPALRDDIALFPGPADRDGAPSWTLHDPVTNRFFSIGWRDFTLLSHWRDGGDPQDLADQVAGRRGQDVGVDDVAALARFLGQNGLLRPRPGGWRVLAQTARQQRAGRSLLGHALHSYLFIRLPLVRPEAFLARTEPWVRPLMGRNAALCALAAAMVGLFFVLRQWDVFWASVQTVFSVQGMLCYAAAVMVVKAIHELGHAWTLRRYGAPVPSMGLVLMVLWPMLYTDSSHAWRLRSHRARFHVAAGGILAEAQVAAYALLAWTLLPDGALRSAAFFLCTSSLVMSLAINLNPFARFDGYYLLSDALGEANLQDRSFVLAKWWLRRLLGGLDDPCPEEMEPSRCALLIIYGVACWVYRVILFTGIALLVYHFIVKVVGIVLMAVEIGWFILMPVWREVRVWWHCRRRILAGPGRWRLGVGGAILGLVLGVPWQDALYAPALLRPQETKLFVPEDSRLALRLVSSGAVVQAGQALFKLHSPEVESRLSQALSRLRGLDTQLAEQGSDFRFAQRLGMLRERRDQAAAELAGLRERADKFTLFAPSSGQVATVLPDAHEGRWLAAKTPLVTIVDPARWMVTAYVEEGDMAFVAVGDRAVFHGGGGRDDGIDAVVEDVDLAGVTTLDDAVLGSPNAGEIPAVKLPDGRLQPRHGLYRVRLSVPVPPLGAVRSRTGSVSIQGRARSLMGRFFDMVLPVLVRESGLS